jgi:site-specific recombinase XerD
VIYPPTLLRQDILSLVDRIESPYNLLCHTAGKSWRKSKSKEVVLWVFQKKDIRNFSDEDIKKFIADLQKKGLKSKTIKNYVMELKTFFNSKKKVIPPDKVQNFPKISVQKPPIHYLSERLPPGRR